MNETGSNTYRKSSRCWLILVCCCLLTGVGFALPMTCFSVFIKPLVGGLETQVTQIALYFTFIGLGSMISSIVSPRFIVKAVKPMVAGSAVLMFLSYAALAMYPSVPLVWIAGFLCGLCYPVCSVLLVPMVINNWFAKNQGTFVGIALAMIGIFGAIFSPVITAIIQNAGYQTALVVMGTIILVVVGVIGLFVIQISPIPLGILPYGATEEQVREEFSNAAAAKKTVNPDLPGLTLKDAMRVPGFYLVALALICMGVVGCLNTQLNTVAQVSGFDAVVAGIALSCSSVGMFVGKIFLGWVKDRVGASVAVIVGAALGIVSFVLLLMAVFGTNVMFLYIGALLAGFCMSLSSIGPPLVTADAFGPRDFGGILGVATAMCSVGMVVGTPIYSQVFDITGSYSGMLAALIVIAAAEALLCFVGIRNARSRWAVNSK